MSFSPFLSILREYYDSGRFETSDGETPLISLNIAKGKSTFHDPDIFRQIYFNYMIEKYNNDSKLTDFGNNWQVMSAKNVIYLDGDWLFEESIGEDEFADVCEAMSQSYASEWIEILKDNGFGINMTFTFIPETFPNEKGGFHVFIYTDSDVTIDQRENMYKNVKISFMDSFKNDYTMYIKGCDEFPTEDLLYNKVFDISPLKSLQTLLPFAEKKGASRRYKLINSEGFDPNSPPTEFIIPQIPKSSNLYDIDDLELRADVSNIMNVDGMDPEIETFFKQVTSVEALKDRSKILGKVGKHTIEFVENLIYLADEHILWKQLCDNDKKIRFIRTLIEFVYANYFIENRGRKPTNKNMFINSIVGAVIPLMKRTLRTKAENTKRATWESLKGHVEWFLTRALDGNERTGAIFDDEQCVAYSNYCNLTAKEKKVMKPEEMGPIKLIELRFQHIVSHWTKLVTEIIMNGLTDEIRPFKEVDKDNFDPMNFDARNNVGFDDVLPAQPNVDKSITEVTESFYIKTIRSWTLMFMFVEYYNSNSMTETIRSIISAFVRYYIWVQKDMGGENTIYVYNIHQTQMLTAFPYNQWITDSDGENLKCWIKTIYLQFIKKELQTINKCWRIMPFLANLSNAGIPVKDCVGINVKPLPNFDRDMDNVYKNILSAFTQERYAPPRELNITTSAYFPMRNGLLEFLTDGNVKFHTDNHDKYMNAHTNVTWEENYDPEAEENRMAWQKVNNMLDQIFPLEEEKIYALRLYASTLHGLGQKDQFIIQYGTGGDGKTTINNLMNSMLGTDGVSGSIQVKENGKIIYIRNPKGLSTSMKTETVLVSKVTTHDEGGIIQLKDKRFCSVQEPDPALSGGKLNCSRIKDMTGGSPVSGRKIYRCSETFVPNCLMTLQTNFIPGYSEDSDATRRRLVVMPFRSKFHTKINETRLRNLEFSFPADPMLNHELTTNPKFWQAFFYILLPYAKELIVKNYLPLSNIGQPRSIVDATMDSFSHSNGIVGWINKNIVKEEGKIIQVSEIVQRIIDDHNSSYKINGGVLTSKGRNSQMNEVYQQLGSTYTGSIYKLKDDCYNDDHTSLKPEFERLEISGMENGYGNEEVIAKYFNKYSVENMERSNVIDKSDLYIVGYETKENMEKDVKMEVVEMNGNENQRESSFVME